MRDEQIIKALECCYIHSCCTGCPCEGSEVDCLVGVGKSAIDLINSQKAEIEALIAGQETLQTNLPKVVVKRFERKIKDVQFTIGQTWEIQTALKETLKEMEAE